eukprot:TRINITY_DN2083_c0_g1_i16.p1 TRINITY_DN2083_c0_g1~~TRINITY_DN2083_c0_g1_i16.p1  ORF type:complete len:120 (-),score=26.88 TRINITY_DN2083_c0_g1_i16:91-450(-)
METETGESLMVFILELLKKPFYELRDAVYVTLKGLSRYAWGLKKIAESRDIVDVLLSRNSESSPEGQFWKFTLLENFVSHPEGKKILGLQCFYDCSEYIASGPHFQRASSIPVLKDEVS